MTNAVKEVSMPSDIELLLKLQAIDYDIGELERSKEYLPDMMDNLSREIEEARQKRDNAIASLEEAKIKSGSLELDIASKQTDLQKFQQQMMSIKTNKEYDALVAQIDSIKSSISDNETSLLETLDLIAQVEKDSEEYKKEFDSLEENNSKQLKILQEKIDSIGGKMSGKTDERGDVSTTISRPTLSVYERVRKGKGGAAVVVVKKRACGACYKALTPKKVQEVKRGDRIHTCDNCGRLFFWSEGVSN